MVFPENLCSVRIWAFFGMIGLLAYIFYKFTGFLGNGDGCGLVKILYHSVIQISSWIKTKISFSEGKFRPSKSLGDSCYKSVFHIAGEPGLTEGARGGGIICCESGFWALKGWCEAEVG